MPSKSRRTTILELHYQRMKIRQIARALRISRPAVRKVIRSNSPEVPPLRPGTGVKCPASECKLICHKRSGKSQIHRQKWG